MPGDVVDIDDALISEVPAVSVRERTAHLQREALKKYNECKYCGGEIFRSSCCRGCKRMPAEARQVKE